MVGPPDDEPPVPSAREIANRLVAVEDLAKDLQRRVQDLEAASDAGPPQTHTERNRRMEEAAPGGAQIPPGAIESEPMPPRRDVLSAPHSEQ